MEGSPRPCVYAVIVVIKRDGTDGPKYYMESPTCSLGRSLECDIRIQLPTVNLQHCRVEVDFLDGKLYLVNSAAESRTLIQGVAVEAKTELFHLDVVTIGDRLFRIELPDAEPLVRPVIPSVAVAATLDPPAAVELVRNLVEADSTNNSDICSSECQSKASSTAPSKSPSRASSRGITPPRSPARIPRLQARSPARSADVDIVPRSPGRSSTSAAESGVPKSPARIVKTTSVTESSVFFSTTTTEVTEMNVVGSSTPDLTGQICLAREESGGSNDSGSMDPLPVATDTRADDIPNSHVENAPSEKANSRSRVSKVLLKAEKSLPSLECNPSSVVDGSVTSDGSGIGDQVNAVTSVDHSNDASNTEHVLNSNDSITNGIATEATAISVSGTNCIKVTVASEIAQTEKVIHPDEATPVDAFAANNKSKKTAQAVTKAKSVTKATPTKQRIDDAVPVVKTVSVGRSKSVGKFTTATKTATGRKSCGLVVSSVAESRRLGLLAVKSSESFDSPTNSRRSTSRDTDRSVYGKASKRSSSLIISDVLPESEKNVSSGDAPIQVSGEIAMDSFPPVDESVGVIVVNGGSADAMNNVLEMKDASELKKDNPEAQTTFNKRSKSDGRTTNGVNDKATPNGKGRKSVGVSVATSSIGRRSRTLTSRSLGMIIQNIEMAERGIGRTPKGGRELVSNGDTASGKKKKVPTATLR